MLIRTGLGVLASLTAAVCFGHGAPQLPDVDPERRIQFPDTAEYLTLVFDPHTHSVFSDGHVWPRIRVGEALLDGLDAMAVTEHLEYQPHLADIPHPDRNRAYQVTLDAAADSDLLIIPGSEITRESPVGHMNAIFIEDANALFRMARPEDPADVRTNYLQANEWPAQAAVQAANDQGAFVFWNHPYWDRGFPNGIPVMPEFHAQNARSHLLHGIEIANGDSYSEETFQIALDYDLALMGVSDIHELIDWDYRPEQGGHRPVTLVLARERSAAGLREALFDRRTVVWFKNLLIGRPQHLEPLLTACLTVDEARYPSGSKILSVTLRNTSDAELRLRNTSPLTFFERAEYVDVPANTTLELRVKSEQPLTQVDLEFEVLNALVAPRQPATLALSAAVVND